MISYDVCLSLSDNSLSMTISRSIHVAANGIIDSTDFKFMFSPRGRDWVFYAWWYVTQLSFFCVRWEGNLITAWSALWTLFIRIRPQIKFKIFSFTNKAASQFRRLQSEKRSVWRMKAKRQHLLCPILFLLTRASPRGFHPVYTVIVKRGRPEGSFFFSTFVPEKLETILWASKF